MMASSLYLESEVTMAPEQGLAAKEPIINNKVGTNPEKESDGADTRLLVGTEPDARMENGKRAPRYFNGYGENDDEVKEEKPKRMHKRCYICGDVSHQGKRCKKFNACFICSRKGHLVLDCPNKNDKEDSASTPCLKCGKTGHDMFSCTNDYDPEDLKLIECYICKQVGHLCCVGKEAEGPREASCYNCGQSGHFGLECTKLNKVPYGLQPLCRKCGEKGHSKRRCTKAKSAKKDAAATKPGKKKSRKARSRKNNEQTPTGNAPQQNGVWLPPIVGPYHGRPPTGNASQPNGVWCLPIVGPYYGRPGSNVWLSPAAAAARSNLSHQGGALPSHQHIHRHHHQVGTQVANSFDPLTGLPHQCWSPQIGTQITRLPIIHETGIMLPQTAAIPTWRYEKGTKLLQPHLNRGTKIQLPQTESQAPRNSSGFVDPISLSNLRPSSTTT